MMKLLQTPELIVEITEYFEAYPEYDEMEIRAKRRDMVSLALTCSALSKFALDTLWKYMTSLPMDRVFLAAFPHITKIESIPTLDENTLSRADSYLRRIRHLKASTDVQYALLQYRGLKPIPNLRSLYLELGGGERDFYTLISTSLSSLSLNARSSMPRTTTLALIAACSGILNLLHLDIKGRIASTDFEELASYFPDLRSLSIHDTSIYDVYLLLAFESLTTLKIDLASFKSMLGVNAAISTLDSLTTLELRGEWNDVESACEGSTFSKINSLSFDFLWQSQLDRAGLFQLLISSFPHVHSLSIRSDAKTDSTINIEDFLGLRDAPIEIFKFRAGPSTLFEEDIIELIKTWPMLRHLEIGHCKDIDIVPTLEYLLHHKTRLQHLELPMSFEPLKRVASWDKNLHFLTLRKLVIGGDGVPEHPEEQVLLAKALIGAFPRLEIDAWDSDFMPGLKGSFDLIKEVLLNPPWTLDILSQLS